MGDALARRGALRIGKSGTMERERNKTYVTGENEIQATE